MIILSDHEIKLSPVPLPYFQVADVGTLDGKTHRRSNVMKALYACSTGVDMQQVPFAVGHHFQDV